MVGMIGVHLVEHRIDVGTYTTCRQMHCMCHDIDSSSFEPAFRDALKNITQSQFNRPRLLFNTPGLCSRQCRLHCHTSSQSPHTTSSLNLARATLHQYIVRLPCKMCGAPPFRTMLSNYAPPAPPVWRATPTPTPTYTHTVVMEELCQLWLQTAPAADCFVAISNKVSQKSPPQCIPHLMGLEWGMHEGHG